MILAKASLSYNRSFIVLATVIMIVNYNFKTFIVQATGWTLVEHSTQISKAMGLRLCLMFQILSTWF